MCNTILIRISNQDNGANQDGGGISLAQGAILRVDTPTCGSACQSSMRANGLCDLACMTAGCNWDDGEVLIKQNIESLICIVSRNDLS